MVHPLFRTIPVPGVERTQNAGAVPAGGFGVVLRLIRGADDALFRAWSTDGRSPGDGVHRTVAGGWLGPGVVSPGTGLDAPERGRDRAAGLSRTGRAPGVLFSFAGGICLPRPGRRCGGTRLVRRLQASGSQDEAARRRRPGVRCRPRERDRQARAGSCARPLPRGARSGRRASRGLCRASGPAAAGSRADQCSPRLESETVRPGHRRQVPAAVRKLDDGRETGAAAPIPTARASRWSAHPVRRRHTTGTTGTVPIYW